MPRGKDLALLERDKRIMQKVADGQTYAQIAEAEGISKQRVGQIVLAHYEDISADGNRAWMRNILERLVQELLPEATGPGKRLISPKGPVYELDENGDPDYSRPLYDRHANREVADTIVKIFDRMSKNYGLDPWRATDQEDNKDLEQYIVWATQMAEESRKNIDHIQELEARLARYETNSIPEAEIVNEDH